MCTSNLPKYSSKLRDTFRQINPHYISCTYKKLFEDHGIDILCSLSDIEDADMENFLDPPESRISQKKSNEQVLHKSRSAPASPSISYKPGCQVLLTMFLSNTSLKTSQDGNLLRDQGHVIEPWQTCTLSDKESCCTVHDSVSITSSPSKAVPSGNVNSNAARSPVTHSPASNPPSARESPSKGKRPALHEKHSDSRIKPINNDDTLTKTNKTKSANLYSRRQEISYPFSHGEMHHGHIKQYRDKVTKANLQQALVRYPSTMIRSRFRTASVLMNSDLVRPSYKYCKQANTSSVNGSRCSNDQLQSSAQEQRAFMSMEGNLNRKGECSPCAESISSLSDGTALNLGAFPCQKNTPSKLNGKGYNLAHSKSSSAAAKRLPKVDFASA